MKIGELHHVEIYVHSLDESKIFWGWLLCEKLGYTEFQNWSLGVSYRLGSTYIVFVQTENDFQEPAFHRKRTGLNHLAFHGGTQEQVLRLREEMLQRGIPLLYDEKFPYAGGENYYALFCEDPNRIKVEIVASNA